MLSVDARPRARPASGFVRWATAGVLVCAFGKVLQLVGVLEQFPRTAQDGPSGRFATSIGRDAPSLPLSIAWSASALATAVLVVVALTRAYGNRAARGLPLPISKRRYATYWFIPLMNLGLPFAPTMQIWDGAPRGPSERLLHAWWWSWVLSSLGPVLQMTTPLSSGWNALIPPFRIYDAAIDLTFAMLTIVVLRHVAAMDDSTRLTEIPGHPAATSAS